MTRRSVGRHIGGVLDERSAVPKVAAPALQRWQTATSPAKQTMWAFQSSIYSASPSRFSLHSLLFRVITIQAAAGSGGGVADRATDSS